MAGLPNLYLPGASSTGGNVTNQPTMTPQQGQQALSGYQDNTGYQQALANMGAQYGGNYSPYLANPYTIAQINPALSAGATIGQTQTVDPNFVQQLLGQNTPDLSSNNTIAQILQGFQPQQRQAQASLNDQLAAAGLSGGPAVAAQNNLNTQLTQALAPTIAQAIQQSQANQLQSGQFNVQQLLNTLGSNASAVNSGNQAQAQLTQQNNLANADALNAAKTTNAGAYNATNAANVAQQNQSQEAYLNALANEYLAQFSAFNSINDAGLGAQNDIAVNGAQSFGVPGSSPFSGLSSSFGSLYSPTTSAKAGA